MLFPLVHLFLPFLWFSEETQQYEFHTEWNCWMGGLQVQQLMDTCRWVWFMIYSAVKYIPSVIFLEVCL